MLILGSVNTFASDMGGVAMSDEGMNGTGDEESGDESSGAKKNCI